MNRFDEILNVYTTQDIANGDSIKIYKNITKKLKLSRRDWVDSLVSIDDKKFPKKIFNLEKNKMVKINNLKRFDRFLMNMSEDGFALNSIFAINMFFKKMMNPIKNTLNKKEQK